MNIGEWNTLRIDRFTSIGAYLEDQDGNDVLLPGKYVLDEWLEDDEVDVFVYRDSEDRIISTTLIPACTVNQFAVLQVKEVNQYGAFAEWGVEKHLFIPFREQPKRLEEGKYYMIYVYLDDATQRLAGSTRLHRFLKPASDDVLVNDQVELVIAERTELGVKCIVDHQFQGLIFNSDIHQTLKMGYRLKGYVKKVREDGKLDIALLQQGYQKVDGLAGELIQLLQDNEGFLPLNDKSDPEHIQQLTGWSKKVFKQVVGNLYKQRIIAINDNGIGLVDND